MSVETNLEHRLCPSPPDKLKGRLQMDDILGFHTARTTGAEQ